MGIFPEIHDPFIFSSCIYQIISETIANVAKVAPLNFIKHSKF